MKKTNINALPFLPVLAAMSLASLAADVNNNTINQSYSPYANQAYPQNVYWGDTHVHSNISADAYSRGNRLSLDDTFRFARGETVRSTTGQPVKLSRPLDFVVAADHAEFLGVMNLLHASDPPFLKTALGQRWHSLKKDKGLRAVMAEFLAVTTGQLPLNYANTTKNTVWQQVAKTVDHFNNPGIFTTLQGYEWSATPNGNNLHRNVIFQDNAQTVSQLIPVSALDSPNPESLWQSLAIYEKTTGGKALAIPHNGNASNGLMYSNKEYSGKPISLNYAQTRARWEPLLEITQIKGDGESHPLLSPDDEFANYETWDASNLTRQVVKEPWMLQYEYGRSALKVGLKIEQQIGSNPFKYGFIGSSDTHTGLAGVQENNFMGKFSTDEPRANRALWGAKSRTVKHIKPYIAKNHAASGYAAVWAEKNNRTAIFNAMLRKETYATTGPRMIARFFGGWHFTKGDDLRPDYPMLGYKKGVPMGGDLYQPAHSNQAPTFLVVASKDPQGANLDRIQIVKGWLNANGRADEKVYNVSVSNNRSIINNTVVALASTVNINTATYTNSQGDVQLSTVWSDPDFKPKQRAFYYMRVLEISTPRWSTYDAAFYNTDLPKGVPAQHQERAYTSPIWYTPATL